MPDPGTGRRAPGEGRYAHVEREQRWLVGHLPPEVARPVSIVDLYLPGTGLRLRRIESADGMVLKLVQKVRPRAEAPDVVKLTNMYLSRAEYDTIARLGGAELRKVRWRVLADGRPAVVDQFEGRLAGLVLAEVELGPDEPRRRPPPWAVAEVTDDDRFSGGALAFSTPDEVGRLLDEVAKLGG